MSRGPSARTVVVGPIPPFKGGVAQHTHRLAEALLDFGADVTVETWAAQYPSFLYPGEQYAPRSPGMDAPPYQVVRSLRWFDPIGWIRCGRRIRSASTVVLTLVVPVQVIPFLVLRWFATRSHRRPRVVLVAHNNYS